MTTLSDLEMRLDVLLEEIKNSVDFSKRYDDIIGCIQYIDLMKERLEKAKTTSDPKLRYGLVMGIAQIGKGLADLGGWRHNPKVEPLVQEVSKTAMAIIKEEGL